MIDFSAGLLHSTFMTKHDRDLERRTVGLNLSAEYIEFLDRHADRQNVSRSALQCELGETLVSIEKYLEAFSLYHTASDRTVAEMLRAAVAQGLVKKMLDAKVSARWLMMRSTDGIFEAYDHFLAAVRSEIGLDTAREFVFVKASGTTDERVPMHRGVIEIMGLQAGEFDPLPNSGASQEDGA
jgi:hypothetical protein